MLVTPAGLVRIDPPDTLEPFPVPSSAPADQVVFKEVVPRDAAAEDVRVTAGVTVVAETEEERVEDVVCEATPPLTRTL